MGMLRCERESGENKIAQMFYIVKGFKEITPHHPDPSSLKIWERGSIGVLRALIRQDGNGGKAAVPRPVDGSGGMIDLVLVFDGG
jgi:hypothetical protein